jgi:hypothetical protein
LAVRETLTQADRPLPTPRPMAVSMTLPTAPQEAYNATAAEAESDTTPASASVDASAQPQTRKDPTSREHSDADTSKDFTRAPRPSWTRTSPHEMWKTPFSVSSDAQDVLAVLTDPNTTWVGAKCNTTSAAASDKTAVQSLACDDSAALGISNQVTLSTRARHDAMIVPTSVITVARLCTRKTSMPQEDSDGYYLRGPALNRPVQSWDPVSLLLSDFPNAPHVRWAILMKQLLIGSQISATSPDDCSSATASFWHHLQPSALAAEAWNPFPVQWKNALLHSSDIG